MDGYFLVSDTLSFQYLFILFFNLQRVIIQYLSQTEIGLQGFFKKEEEGRGSCCQAKYFLAVQGRNSYPHFKIAILDLPFTYVLTTKFSSKQHLKGNLFSITVEIHKVNT